jgi:hypothetical protein
MVSSRDCKPGALSRGRRKRGFISAECGRMLPGGGMTGILPVSGVGARISGQLLWAGRARRRISPVCCRAAPLAGRWPRRDGVLLRHRLRRRTTRRISRGRLRCRLSRWRRWRRRSLSGCRAGCHQSCQDQKKRFSLHGEQILPRYRCSPPAQNRLVFGLPALRIRFSVVAGQNAPAAISES